MENFALIFTALFLGYIINKASRIPQRYAADLKPIHPLYLAPRDGAFANSETEFLLRGGDTRGGLHGS